MLFISLGVFMRDVTLCNEGTPKKLRNGLYNFSKLRTLVMMVRFFIHIQLPYLFLHTYTSRPLSCPFLPHSYVPHPLLIYLLFLHTYPSPLSFSTSFLYVPHPLLIYLLFLHAYSSLCPFLPPSYMCHTPFLSIFSFFIPTPPLCPFLPPLYMCHTPFLSISSFFIPTPPLCPFLPPSYMCHTPFLSISSFFIRTPPLCPFLPPLYMCHTPFLSISSFFIPTPPLCPFLLYVQHPLLINLLFLHTCPSSLLSFAFLCLILPSRASPNLPSLPSCTCHSPLSISFLLIY